VRGADAAARDDKIVFGAHAPYALDDFFFVVGDYFDAFELDAEGEAPAGKVGGVCVYCLIQTMLEIRQSFARTLIECIECTFPPRTSSPMIRHAAVCIVLDLFSWNVADDVMLGKGCAEDARVAADE
jgi:hypothetical protein